MRNFNNPKIKTMGQTTIKSMIAQGTYQGQSGPVYKFEVELEDGTIGEVGAMTEDRWSEGDEVEYTATDTKWGPKLKLQKPGYTGGGSTGGYRKDPETQKRIENSWALQTAVQILGPNKATKTGYDEYMESVRGIALNLLMERDNLTP